VRSRLDVNNGPAWIAVIYADWQSAPAPDPESILGQAIGTDRIVGVLVDTWDKTRPIELTSVGFRGPRGSGKPASWWRWPAGSIADRSRLSAGLLRTSSPFGARHASTAIAGRPSALAGSPS